MKTVDLDPVCGMKVEANTEFRSEKKGTIYLFCSKKCQDQFLDNPDKFIEQGLGESGTIRPQRGSEKQRQKGRGSSWKDYIPLIVIITTALLAACAKQVAYGGWTWMNWMHDFMGFFLVVFSMFKFFNMEGFADGFQMYDLLAKRFRPYAYVYPFIELGLGLGYLSHWQPVMIYSATLLVMVFGSLGVFNALRKDLDVECACMGTVLSVPLSTVALTEDLSMAAMAAGMLLLVL